MDLQGGYVVDHDRFVYKPHSCSLPLRNLCIAAVHYIAASSRRLAPNDAPASTLVGASLSESHTSDATYFRSVRLCMYRISLNKSLPRINASSVYTPGVIQPIVNTRRVLNIRRGPRGGCVKLSRVLYVVSAWLAKIWHRKESPST